jgi:hypothetical protein
VRGYIAHRQLFQSLHDAHLCGVEFSPFRGCDFLQIEE